ncbi:MAG: 6-bladed beta-propeller [Gemmatimonadetes bacterium]|nr:6-bladed beta-propeller [Gemmatimonadota bacterium]
MELRIGLTPAADDPIGEPSAIVAWRGGFAVVDEMQGNVKTFDHSGRFTGALGRPGDGPGEFRRPFAAVPLPDGRLAVLDRSPARVSYFDSKGAYIESWRFPGGAPGGMRLAPDGRGLVISGQLESERDAGTGSRPFGVHLFSLAGAHLRSFHRIPAPVVPQETSFWTTSLAIVGGTAISGQYSRNTVRGYDLRTGREWSVAVGGSFYRRPEWARAQEVRQLRDAARFHDSGMWLAGLVAVDCARFMARFVTKQNGQRRFQYAVYGIDGRAIVMTTPGSIKVTDSHDGRLVATHVDDEGNVELLYLRPKGFALNRCEPGPGNGARPADPAGGGTLPASARPARPSPA